MAGTDEFKIVRAERTQARLRVALQSPAGGGKTATSLLLARGMVEGLQARGKLPRHLDDCFIGLLDTERDSAKLYSHLVTFDTIVLEPPYTVDRYLGALGALERVGYPIIIIDQISHEWTGEGGILSQVSKASGTNGFANWNGPSQDHDRFIDAMLRSPAHLIATMRAKTEWVLEEEVQANGRTKKVPKRIGMAATQRAGTEFEFTTVLDLEVGTNAARCVKDRTELFAVNQTVPRMGPEWGVKMIDWVYTAKKAEAIAGGPTPVMQAEAMCDAGVRLLERCSNAPDLETVFLEQRKLLRGMAVSAGAEAVDPLIGRLIAAASKRKGELVLGPSGRVHTDGELISPDDVVNLEILLTDAGVDASHFKSHFQIARVALLPLARLDDAQTFIIDLAAVRGTVIAPFKHVPEKAPPRGAPTGPEILNRLVGQIAEERDAENPTGSFFAGMKDDLPFPAPGSPH
jgi:hypothetical protein